jgi:hypothetical protein
MDYLTVLSRIGDIPATFLRNGNPFTAWQTAQALQLSEFSYGSDALVPQMTFTSSNFGWLDVWGELFGIPRNPDEANSVYQNRITETLKSPVGTLYAIRAYGFLYFGKQITVLENLSGLGYIINLPTNIDVDAVPQFIINLERIRPAGVPFTLELLTNNAFVNSFQYLNGQSFAGTYLGGNLLSSLYNIPEPITNSQPILPSLLITDPILSNTLAVPPRSLGVSNSNIVPSIGEIWDTSPWNIGGQWG